MANKIKLSFKTVKATGKWRTFSKSTHHIKIDGKVVGAIEQVDNVELFKIRFQVMKTDTLTDSNSNCSWISITLRKQTNSLKEAQDWLKLNIVAITEKYELYKFE